LIILIDGSIARWQPKGLESRVTFINEAVRFMIAERAIKLSNVKNK